MNTKLLALTLLVALLIGLLLMRSHLEPPSTVIQTSTPKPMLPSQHHASSGEPSHPLDQR